MTQEELKEIIRLHGLYLRGESDGVRADLSGANLSGTNFSDANLGYADLSEANLRCANLSGANLSYAKDGDIARLDFGGWSICVRSDETTIGCQKHSNVKWLSWSPDSPEIASMHVHAAEWWRVHGDAVQAVIRCVMSKASSIGRPQP